MSGATLRESFDEGDHRPHRSAPAGDSMKQVFIARQPVFTKFRQVYGYELLFRAGVDNAFPHADGDQASVSVIADSIHLFGMEKLTAGKRAFINFTRDTLLKGYASMLPKDSVVIEILETVEPDAEVVEAVRELKRYGYLVALDDFVTDTTHPLLSLVDIVKVDVALTTPAQREMLPRTLGRSVQLLAEKIETRAEFNETAQEGYTFFQGYFLERPHIMARQAVPGFKLHYLQVLREIRRPDLNFAQIEGILKREISLSYRLMRYVNSVAHGFRDRVRSVQHALVLLGDELIRKWASMIVLAGIAEDQPREAVVISVVRARLCESMATTLGMADRASDLFLVGLFSMLDVIIGRPLEELIDDLPLEDDVKGALIGQRNRLRWVLECALAYEHGDWNDFARLAKILEFDEHAMPAMYLGALEWAHQSIPYTFKSGG